MPPHIKHHATPRKDAAVCDVCMLVSNEVMMAATAAEEAATKSAASSRVYHLLAQHVALDLAPIQTKLGAPRKRARAAPPHSPRGVPLRGGSAAPSSRGLLTPSPTTAAEALYSSTKRS